MNRSIQFACIVFLLLLNTGPAQAQNRQPQISLESQIEAARGVMRTQRKLIIASELFLTSEESKAFWPIFNEYAEDMRAIGDTRVRLIIEYANNFDSMTSELAAKLLAKLAAWRKSVDAQSMSPNPNYDPNHKKGKKKPAKKKTAFNPEMLTEMDGQESTG